MKDRNKEKERRRKEGRREKGINATLMVLFGFSHFGQIALEHAWLAALGFTVAQRINLQQGREFPLWLSKLRTRLVSVKMWVESLAIISG